MQFQSRFRSSRFVALFTGAVIASAMLFQAAPAHADKAKNLKYGAIGLGVIGAYLLSKGKTVPVAAAAAGGYYAYKKSKEVENDNRYGYNPYGNSSGAVYPDSYGSDYAYQPQYRSSASVSPRRENKRDRGSNYDVSPYAR